MSKETPRYGVFAVCEAPTEQVGGTHYKDMEIDVYEFAERNKLTPMQFNVVRYTCRFPKKNGKEDLLKAMHTLNRMIQFYYPDEHNG
jgi:hypothetical protein